MADIGCSLALAGVRERLARVASREDVDRLDLRPVDDGQVTEVRDARPLPLDAVVAQRAGREFPYGTLAVNLLGTLLLGVLAGAALEHDAYRVAATGLPVPPALPARGRRMPPRHSPAAGTASRA